MGQKRPSSPRPRQRTPATISWSPAATSSRPRRAGCRRSSTRSCGSLRRRLLETWSAGPTWTCTSSSGPWRTRVRFFFFFFFFFFYSSHFSLSSREGRTEKKKTHFFPYNFLKKKTIKPKTKNRDGRGRPGRLEHRRAPRGRHVRHAVRGREGAAGGRVGGACVKKEGKFWQKNEK